MIPILSWPVFSNEREHTNNEVAREYERHIF
jgi:hypothetical protein